MRARVVIGLVLCTGFARADIGPPPRNDCALLAPGTPCWAEGKRAGACVVAFDGGPIVCAAGVAPTRAIASAKPVASAPAPPATETRSGCSLRGLARGATLPWLVALLALTLARRRARG
ncbi:MAG: hypothetical protein HS104_22905 [Polyangiaceae bacterium]|nr:hypothetical protein [Polyangiaceae bacterium]MCE7891053.1 hypothetical protein [Sorangiineae bacterium PRO1]MCL4755754.1 hypothetical protein [Myxococcales bacterium]